MKADDDEERTSLTTPTGRERRQHERRPVTLIVEYADAEDLIEDYTSNLSVGGVFVHTAREFTVGTEIDLVLSFPGLLHRVEVCGIVRWTGKAETGEAGIGLEFVNVEGASLSELHELVDRLKSGDPALVGSVIRILLAEDNPHVARLVEQGLAQASQKSMPDNCVFDFDTTFDGQTALDFLQNGAVYDLAIIDMQLPMVTGTELVRYVRQEYGYPDIPVIGVSSGGAADREAAEEIGCTAFLDKPFRLRELLQAIESVLFK